jgi:hypothetical protein
MKTNRQILEECAQAVWSWLCERYSIPLPSIRGMVEEQHPEWTFLCMPHIRVSPTRRNSFFAPGNSSMKPGEVTIAQKKLLWLPKCPTKNSIESWTLQLVEEFTRAIELRESLEGRSRPTQIAPRATLNQIEFAREFFPHLYKEHRGKLNQIARDARLDLKKGRSKNPLPARSRTVSAIRKK